MNTKFTIIPYIPSKTSEWLCLASDICEYTMNWYSPGTLIEHQKDYFHDCETGQTILIKTPKMKEFPGKTILG
jgi:hypothetical protein